MYRKISRQQKISHSANVSSWKWALAKDGTKFTSICRDSLYANLYGSRTLAYWAEKDNIPKDPKRILWEESRLAMKRMSRSQRQIDTKLLCNQCEFEKTKFDRRHPDLSCPVYSGPKENRNHMFTCQGSTAVSNRKKQLPGFKKMLEELGTAQILTTTIIGSLRHVYNGTTPSVHSFGQTYFGGNISLRGIIEDQANISGPIFCATDGVWSGEKHKRDITYKWTSGNQHASGQLQYLRNYC